MSSLYGNNYCINIKVYILKPRKGYSIGRHEHYDKVADKIQINEHGDYNDLMESVINYGMKVKEITSTYLNKNIADINGRGFSLSPIIGERRNIPTVTWFIKSYDETLRKYEICSYNDICRNLTQTNFMELKKSSTYVVDRWAIYPFTVIRLMKAIYKKSYYKKLYGFSNKNLPDKTHPHGIYFVWRRMRYFASAVVNSRKISGLTGIIMTDNVAFGRVHKEEIAYYYSGVLNALVKIIHDNIEKIKEEFSFDNITFAQAQFKRPIIFLHKLNLDWKELRWQNNIAELSKTLHDNARKIYVEHYNLRNDLVRKSYRNNEDKMFELIDFGRDKVYHEIFSAKNVIDNIELLYRKTDVFKELLTLLQNHIDEQKLIKESRWVLVAAD